MYTSNLDFVQQKAMAVWKCNLMQHIISTKVRILHNLVDDNLIFCFDSLIFLIPRDSGYVDLGRSYKQVAFLSTVTEEHTKSALF